MSLERAKAYLEKYGLSDDVMEFGNVYPACGSSNSAIKLTPEKPEEITDFIKWIDVCKKS